MPTSYKPILQILSTTSISAWCRLPCSAKIRAVSLKRPRRLDIYLASIAYKMQTGITHDERRAQHCESWRPPPTPLLQTSLDNESTQPPYCRSNEFFRALRRKSAIVARFSLLPGVFIYEQLSDDPTSNPGQGCFGSTRNSQKEIRRNINAIRSIHIRCFLGVHNTFGFCSSGSKLRSFHTMHPMRSEKQNDEEISYHVCGNQSQQEPQSHQGQNPQDHANRNYIIDNGKSIRRPPRLAAPERQKALPEPPPSLDPLYFYNYLSRDEIMREISGALPSLRARIRRALKGSYQKRPWTIDDIFALITWAVMSQAMLLLIGTTTTVSVALWLLNRLQYQDWITRRLSVWVSSALGVTVSFQSAIVPAWRNGAIRLKNVKIRCGPEHGKLGEDGSRDSNFTMYDLQIDQIDVALSLWRWMEDRGLISECSMRGVRGVVDRRQVWWDPDTVYLPEEHRSTHQPGYFNLDSLEIDDMLLTVHPWKNFRPITVSIYSANMPRFRDRWLLYDVLCANSVVGMYDGSLFTIHQAHQQISSSEKPPVNPSRVYGSDILAHLSSDIAPKTKPCRGRTTHMQIDNLNIDHVNLGVEGPIGWITSGRMNVSSLINFPDTEPNDNPAAAIKKLVDNISDSIDVVILPSMPDWSNPESSPSPMVRMMYHLDMVDSPLAREMHNRLKRRAERESQRRLEKQRQRTASWSQALAPVRTHQIASPLSPEPGAEDQDQDNTPAMAAHLPNVYEDPTAVHVDLQVEFNDIRASVPLSTPQLGHPLLSSVLVRPIVGYMNAHRTSLPMRCQLRLRSDDFDGAWSLWDSGSDNLITQGIGAAFAQLAQNERERNRRLKLIGIWSVAAVAKQVLRLVDFFYSRHGFFEHSSLSGEAEHT